MIYLINFAHFDVIESLFVLKTLFFSIRRNISEMYCNTMIKKNYFYYFFNIYIYFIYYTKRSSINKTYIIIHYFNFSVNQLHIFKIINCSKSKPATQNFLSFSKNA